MLVWYIRSTRFERREAYELDYKIKYKILVYL